MNRRDTLIVLGWTFAGSALFGAARADDGEADQSGGGHAGDSGSGDENKETAGGESGGGQGATPSSPTMNQDDAKRAVDSSQAIPLNVILDKFRRSGDFTLVDVTLVSRHGRLYYVIEYVETSGAVRTALYDALDASRVR